VPDEHLERPGVKDPDPLKPADFVPDKIVRMPVKKKRASKVAPTPPVELIVRRGALRRFDKLKRATAEMPVKVLWDRRTNDGRGAASPGKRAPNHAERRTSPPFTWDVADFLVVGKRAAERRRGPKR